MRSATAWTMSNPSKKKGTAAETRVVKFLVDHGVKARRQPLSGNKDKGDIKITGQDVILEVKTGKQTANPSRTQLGEWLKQSMVEAENSGCECALVIVRFRRRIEDAEVYIPGSTAHTFMYLDDFAEWLKAR